jgi:hypothetical protein
MNGAVHPKQRGPPARLPARARAGKRWRPEEDERLLELAGRYTTASVAGYLGRSPGAVQQRLHRALGLSPHDADGRYTAAELARALRLPGGRVEQWCRRGLIPAEKLGAGRGGIWRIDWDGVSPVGPARGRCRTCGRHLPDGRRRYCPDRCRRTADNVAPPAAGGPAAAATSGATGQEVPRWPTSGRVISRSGRGSG